MTTLFPLIQNVMRKNLQVLTERLLPLVLFAAFFAAAGSGYAQEPPSRQPLRQSIRWYRSDASGMPLEHIPSRLAALRNEFSLSIERVNPALIPQLLEPYFDESFIVEQRILFERGVESRQQWIFRDPRGIARLVSSGNNALFGRDEYENRAGFIEIRNSAGESIREIRFERDLSQWEFRFSYQAGLLLSAETWFKAAPDAAPPDEYYDAYAVENEPPVLVHIYTDFFRYSRFGSLRSIDRIIHEAGGIDLPRISFPHIRTAVAAGDQMIVQSFVHNSGFLADIAAPANTRITFSVDGRGRVLTETWKNEDDEITGEFTNTWSDDRLLSVVWISGDEERRVEFDYDSGGDRIAERNFRNGILERRVSSRNGLDVEELFMSGALVLRATWEDGLKISEERFMPPAGALR